MGKFITLNGKKYVEVDESKSNPKPAAKKTPAKPAKPATKKPATRRAK